MNQFISLHSIGLAVLLLAFTPLGFAAPANDNLAAATAIDTLPFTVQQNTTDATNEPSEQLPACLNDGTASVWYQYTATANQTVVLNTFDSDYDTVLSVWTGDSHPLTQHACNDDSNNLKQSQVQLELQIGTTYYINISGYQGDTGTLALTALAINPLENDHLAAALPITLDTNTSYTYTQTTQGATTQENESISVCDTKSGGSVWYQYTPSTDQTLIIDTMGSDYNTVLSVWTGTSHPLEEEVICNDDNNGPQSQLRVALTINKTYLINVSAGESPGAGSLFQNTGLLVLNISAPPNNDYLDNAIPITEPLPYTNTQLTGGATVEIGEGFSSCDPTASASVWYLLTPGTDYSNVIFSTIGSSYDTVLSIWEGTDHPLNELACNDNATTFEEQSNSSQITLPLTENLTYYIDVSGVSNGTGQLKLSVAEGEPDFNIGSQPQAQTIEVCESANLVIGLTNKDGEEIEITDNPIGSQWETGVILPFVYRWYQGESGDDSTLIAEIENNPVFTPTPKETTQYWAHITNPTGSMDSQTVTVTVTGDSETLCEPPPPTDLETNGIGIDIDGDEIPTTTDFQGLITLSGENTPIETVSQTDEISVTFNIAVEANHVGQTADLIIVAIYTTEVSYFYMRLPEGIWTLWENGNFANLEIADTVELTDNVDVTIHKDNLNGLPGLFTIYIGYRLDNGSIFYTGEPITFTVK